MYAHTPAADFYMSDDAFLLTLDLPGVAESEIDVTVEGAVLTLRAGGGEDAPPRWFRRFRIPRAINREQITATHDNGTLQLLLPRTSESIPRRVKVNAAG